jgi:hypothetical protein
MSKKTRILNVSNYVINKKLNISLEIQLKIILENEYNNDIICIQTTDNITFINILNILNFYNYFYSPDIKYKKYNYMNLITLSKFKILDYSYHYEDNINYLITSININKKKYYIINTDIIYNKKFEIVINNLYNMYKIENILIFGLSFKKNTEYLSYINRNMLFNNYNKRFFEHNILKKMFFYKNNSTLLIKQYNINDKLLSKNFYKLILFLY